jgi:predicted TIM-barrel fold metal-dependent hydrolase
MMICDSHAHYGEKELMKAIVDSSPLTKHYLCYQAVQFESMSDYDDYMQKQGQNKIAYIPFVFRELSKLEENRKILDYAKGREHVYPYVLLDEDNVNFVRDNHQAIVGVKEHFVMHDTALNERRVAIFADIDKYNLNILLHTRGGNVRVEYVQSILELFPNIKVHVAHLGRERPEDVDYIYWLLEQLRPYDNVFFDTSTIRQTQVLEQAVRIVGRERILYGSDFPFYMDGTGQENIVKAQIDHVLNAELTDTDRSYILQKNFEWLITKGS